MNANAVLIIVMNRLLAAIQWVVIPAVAIEATGEMEPIVKVSWAIF